MEGEAEGRKGGRKEEKWDRVEGGREGKRGWLRLGWGLRRDLWRGRGKKEDVLALCYFSIYFKALVLRWRQV